jgi:hypothetical protein
MAESTFLRHSLKLRVTSTQTKEDEHVRKS